MNACWEEKKKAHCWLFVVVGKDGNSITVIVSVQTICDQCLNIITGSDFCFLPIAGCRGNAIFVYLPSARCLLRGRWVVSVGV